MTIGSFILAAGESLRFGSPKALALIENELALLRLVRISNEARVGSPVVVLGAQADLIRSKLSGEDFKIVINADYPRGQTSSLQTALLNLDPAIDAAVYFLVDHPFIKVETVQKMKEVSEEFPEFIVRPRFEGKGGHPTILPKRVWKSLVDLHPTSSARVTLSADSKVKWLDVNDCGVVEHFNTRGEYESACQRCRRFPTNGAK